MRWSRTGPCVPLLLALAASAPGGARADGPRVRVLAEARIGLQADRSGGGLVLRGVLRDELGGELPGRPLELRLDVDGEVARTVRLMTDARGTYRHAVDGDLAPTAVEVLFRGDPWHDARRVRRSLRAGLEDVRLRFVADEEAGTGEGSRIDLDGPPLRVSIAAGADGGAADLPVVLENERGERLAEGVTDDSGRLALDVPASRLGPPGPGRLVARSREHDGRAAATSEQPILRVRRTLLRVTDAPERASAGRPVTVAGRLSFAAGGGEPVAHVPVGVYVDGSHVGTALTDEEGAFRVRAPLPDGPPGDRHVVARFEGPGAGLEPSESAAVGVSWSRGPDGRWAGGAALLLGVAVAFLGLRRRRAAAGTPAVAPPGVRLAPRRLRPRHAVGGRVLTADGGVPLAGARVRVDDGAGDRRALPVEEDGRFASGPLGAGTWTLTVDAPDHGAHVTSVTVPHRGEWSDVEVRLEGLRAVALGHFRRAVAPVLPTSRRWEVETNREIVRSVGESPPLLELERRVERLYYGPERPTREAVEALSEHPGGPDDERPDTAR